MVSKKLYGYKAAGHMVLVSKSKKETAGSSATGFQHTSVLYYSYFLLPRFTHRIVRIEKVGPIYSWPRQACSPESHTRRARFTVCERSTTRARKGRGCDEAQTAR